MPRPSFFRRLVGTALIVLLQGCSSDQVGPWPQYMQLLRQGFRNSFGNQLVTLEQAAAIPYASLSYRINGGNEALLVLATDTNGQMLWTAASRVVLLTKDGRIVRSVGLPRDRAMMTAQGAGTLPPPAAALQMPYRSVRVLDMPDIGAYSVSLTCETQQGRLEIVRILGTAMATVRVDERCQSSNPRWSFTDSYWLDRDSGFVWRSVQHLHPAGVRIDVSILRPPE